MKSWFPSLALCGLFIGTANAAEIGGAVREAGGGRAEIAVRGNLVPAVGDQAEIYFKIPGGDDEVAVAKGKVAEVAGDSVSVKIENATGTVAKNQLVRFTSENPQMKTGAPVPATSAPPPPMPPRPGSTIVPRIAPPQPSVEKITFDHLKAAPGLSSDAFAAQGAQLVLGPGCDARIERATSAMTLPEGRSQLLMVVQQPRTSQFSLAFKQPLHRVSVTRIGVTQGGSLPKWRLTAMAANGNVLGSTGEDKWGSDAQPRTFSVEGDGIVQVRIDVDNRWGTGTYATYSCLPIAEIELVPQQGDPPPPVVAPTPATPSHEAPPVELPGGPVPGS